MPKLTTLPKTATIAGRNIRLQWEPTNNLDGWYAQVSPRRVRQLEADATILMADVVDELSRYGDYARYGQERTGETYLCVYKAVE